MNAHMTPPGIRRVLDRARLAVDPELAERERRAVAMCAALVANSLLNSLKRFTGDPAEAERLRCRAKVLAAEVEALARMCGAAQEGGGEGII